MCSSEFLVILVILSILGLIVHVRRRRTHPPGPVGVPLLGILPSRLVELVFSKWIKSTPDATRFKQYKDRYGPIWSLEIGMKRIVTLGTWTLIKEAFVDNADLFSGRSQNSSYRLISHGRGLIFTDGEIWRGHRHLAIKSLRNLGMGGNGLEARIRDEADDLVSYLEKEGVSTLGPCDLVKTLTKALANVISRLVFCHSNQYQDPHFDLYIKNLRAVAHSDLASKKLALFPLLFQIKILRKWFFPDVDVFYQANEYCYNFILDKCESRKKEIGLGMEDDEDDDQEEDCVFDSFLRHRFSDWCSSSSSEKKEHWKEMVQTMYDLFNAGIDTTSNLLSFCLLFLAKDHMLQRELRKELYGLVEDRGGSIDFSLRSKCPRLLSFIDEVHRFCTIIPKAHHRTLVDCTFQGYRLSSSRDMIFADLVNVHLDPSLFHDPDQFDPYRFLDESRTKYIPSKYLIPFGVGKRSCLGESIATMESFLFLEKIIHRFKITLPKETEDNIDQIMEGHSGLVHAPLDHLINLNTLDSGWNNNKN